MLQAESSVQAFNRLPEEVLVCFKVSAAKQSPLETQTWFLRFYFDREKGWAIKMIYILGMGILSKSNIR